MKHRLSLIVATKDRPEDIRRLLESLRLQTMPPDEIVIVDAGGEPVHHVAEDFSELSVRYFRYWPPSASAQRNAGIQACSSTSTLIGFADDDTTFEPSAFENMMDFWEQAEADILGAAFNIRNYPDQARSLLKQSRLAERLGLYSPKIGSVSPSGWQTVTGEIHSTEFVKWLPSTAVLFRRDALPIRPFDETLDGYSYLEDLDLSYSICRKGRLAIVADAGYFHFPSRSGRVSTRCFGRVEVRNRLHFVRKHSLSLGRCYLGLAIRLTMTVCGGLVHRDVQYLARALGNLEELCTPRRRELNGSEPCL